MICTADNCVRRFLVYTHIGEGEDKMAAKTVIRPAAEADIPAILALYRQLDSALVAMQPEFFCEGPREEDEIRKAIRADDADFLLAERGGAVVGFALVGYAGWTPEFSCVLPHAMRGWRIWPWTRPCAGRASAASFWRRQALGTQPALGVLRAERAGPERERYPAV